jgi:uncharacterized protein
MLLSEKLTALIFVASLALLMVFEAGQIVRLVYARVSRKSFRTGAAGWVVHVLAAVVVVCGVYGYWVEPYWIEVKHVTVKTDKLHKTSLRIAQFSDTHCEARLRNEAKLVELVNAANADIVVFTGDSLNNAASLPVFKDTLQGMHAGIGKYAVRGNFDCWLWERVDLFGGTGFRELDGSQVTCEKDGERFMLTGVNCLAPEAYSVLLPQVPDDTLSIFLYHYPDLIEDVAGRKVDIYLAGHTHGGQIALPFYGAMVTLARYGKKYESGRYDVGPTMLYVNRGIGMEAGHAPRIRFLARPELTIIDVVPAR